MKNNRRRIFSIARRPFLAGLSSAAGAAVFIRPLIAEAQTGEAPKRFFAYHYPCGAVAGNPAGALTWGFGAGLKWTWLPTGSGTTYTASPLMNFFTPIRDKVLSIHPLTRGDKAQKINGDKHTHGMVYMMNGYVPVPTTNPITPEADPPNAKNITTVDPSIDQQLLTLLPDVFRNSLVAGGAPTQFPSIQLCASPYSMLNSGSSYPCLKVISYSGKNQPMGPEGRSQTAFNNIFGGAMMPGVDTPTFLRQQAQKRSILDFVQSDIKRMQALLPVSQRPKLEAHLQSIVDLENRITDTPPVNTVIKPTLVPEPTGVYEARVREVHANNLAIIRCAFQSDLTRVATFTSGNGNNQDQVAKYFAPPPFTFVGDGHACSHNGKTVDALLAKGEVNAIFLQAVAKMLIDMNATPEGTGTLLDNTLGIVFSECLDGDGHAPVFPMLCAGGKWIKMLTGQHIYLTADRYVNDFWISALTALGSPTTTWGDPVNVTGPLPGVFG